MEAVQQMAAERYLLNELAPEDREAFEEHLFDCRECALDIRAGADFVDEAKLQLPELVAAPKRPIAITASGAAEKKSSWLSWWRPAFAMPAMAALLLVIGYQNFVTYPALRQVAEQPRLTPLIAAHGATRGAEHIAVTADRKNGVAMPVDLEQEPGMPTFASFAFELHDPAQKVVWTSTASGASTDQKLSLEIPGGMLREGTFTLAVAGVGANGEHTALQRIVFDVHLSN